MSGRERTPGEPGFQRSIKPVLISVGIGAGVCIAFILLFSLLLSAQNIPQSLVSPMATFSISMGGLAAGYICAKILRENGLVYGLVCGGVLSLILLLASFGISDNGLGIPALFKIVFILLSSMLGGVLGVNSRRRRRGKR